MKLLSFFLVVFCTLSANAGIQHGQAAIDYYLRTHIINLACDVGAVAVDRNYAYLNGRVYRWSASPVAGESRFILSVQGGLFACESPTGYKPGMYPVRIRKSFPTIWAPARCNAESSFSARFDNCP
jgi:hypothetical protein